MMTKKGVFYNNKETKTRILTYGRSCTRTRNYSITRKSIILDIEIWYGNLLKIGLTEDRQEDVRVTLKDESQTDGCTDRCGSGSCPFSRSGTSDVEPLDSANKLLLIICFLPYFTILIVCILLCII
jgi:hypothetical protein